MSSESGRCGERGGSSRKPIERERSGERLRMAGKTIEREYGAQSAGWEGVQSGSGGHRNKVERRESILSHTPRSHAL